MFIIYHKEYQINSHPKGSNTMLTTKSVIEVHPSWLILFLMAYVAAFYVFDKTNGNIMIAAITLVTWMITSVAILYSYYGLL